MVVNVSPLKMHIPSL